jgi:hypothetical protein
MEDDDMDGSVDGAMSKRAVSRMRIPGTVHTLTIYI